MDRACSPEEHSDCLTSLRLHDGSVSGDKGYCAAQCIPAAEETGLPFADIERIRHAATNSAQLERYGMIGVLDICSAWCGYLHREPAGEQSL
ncbi:hypothetical protein B0T26DRAFT_746516 [Lasiosphaeria miniovina]|uniref:Uncharacterized protein n=1 Tax=Lasiosphaeria miniovina TaxID=1954250 RepID=A0AA40BI42_9PEZI|nr:uncharacterized protein B0T26DRAFT_746516 [Lasiosphaeria miniovina]KAK0734639.1 hypothetical protein B0T26DRAFT_746516 [Lasiosphaeria miniovina]